MQKCINGCDAPRAAPAIVCTECIRGTSQAARLHAQESAVESAVLPALQEALTKIADETVELDRLDAEIGRLIEQIEVNLRDHFSTGISYAMPTSSAGVLAFGKFAGKWQLTIEWQGSDPLALRSCPRRLRYEVFTEGHLERLIHTAGDQIKAQITSRRAAIAIGKSLVISLAKKR